MADKKDLFQGLVLLLIVVVVGWVLVYFQHKNAVNNANHPIKQLTVEDKLRFKGGMSN